MEDNIQNTIQEILERVVRVETKIDNYNGLREKLDNTSRAVEVYEEKIKNIDGRVGKIEDGQKWLWRTIAGALILSFLATYIMWK